MFKEKPETKATKELDKAPLAAKEFQQKKIIEFNDMFAPVSKLSLIRPLRSHALSRNLSVHQGDIKNTFLNVKRDEEIFMTWPRGFVNHLHPGYV